MKESPRKILVLGYGNPGRQDDGLGPAFAEALEAAKLPGVDVRIDYQLTPEDAEAAASYDVVIFADATTTSKVPFTFLPLEGDQHYRFTTHSVSPGTILALAHDLFGSRCVGWILAIRGHSFDAFTEALSPEARIDLATALTFLKQTIAEGGPSRPEAHCADRPSEVLHA